MPKGIGIEHFTPLAAESVFGEWMTLGPRERRGNTMYWLCGCRCGRTNKFVKGADLRLSRSTQCKACQSDANALAQSNPDTAFIQLFGRYKSGAKIRGIAWELTESEFRAITSRDCAYTGLPPSSLLTSLGGSTYVYNSIDRIDSSQGYTLLNCVPCNSQVNRMKGDMPLADFLSLAAAVTKRVAIATW